MPLYLIERNFAEQLEVSPEAASGEVGRFLYSPTTSPVNEYRIATTSLISVWS